MPKQLPEDQHRRDCWHNWKQCAPPDDVVREIEEIARHRQCKPRKVMWMLVRDALRARRAAPQQVKC